MTTPERNPEITRRVGENIRTIWEFIDVLTSDPIVDDEVAEPRQILEAVQEMLTDLTTTGLLQVEHYLSRYTQVEVDAVAEEIRQASER